LKDYLDWCDDKLPGDYQMAFDLLKEHEIGIDMLDSLQDASILMSQTKLAFGMVTRLLKYHKEWLSTLAVFLSF